MRYELYFILFILKEAESSRSVEEDRRNNEPKLGTSSFVLSYILYYLY